MIKQTEKAELRKNGGRRNIAPENGERKPTSKVKNLFRKFAHKTSEIVGSPWSFIIAVRHVDYLGGNGSKLRLF